MRVRVRARVRVTPLAHRQERERAEELLRSKAAAPCPVRLGLSKTRRSASTPVLVIVTHFDTRRFNHGVVLQSDPFKSLSCPSTPHTTFITLLLCNGNTMLNGGLRSMGVGVLAMLLRSRAPETLLWSLSCCNNDTRAVCCAGGLGAMRGGVLRACAEGGAHRRRRPGLQPRPGLQRTPRLPGAPLLLTPGSS